MIQLLRSAAALSFARNLREKIDGILERAGGSPIRQGPTVFLVYDLSRLKD